MAKKKEKDTMTGVSLDYIIVRKDGKDMTDQDHQSIVDTLVAMAEVSDWLASGSSRLDPVEL